MSFTVQYLRWKVSSAVKRDNTAMALPQASQSLPGIRLSRGDNWLKSFEDDYAKLEPNAPSLDFNESCFKEQGPDGSAIYQRSRHGVAPENHPPSLVEENQGLEYFAAFLRDTPSHADCLFSTDKKGKDISFADSQQLISLINLDIDKDPTFAAPVQSSKHSPQVDGNADLDWLSMDQEMLEVLYGLTTNEDKTASLSAGHPLLVDSPHLSRRGEGRCVDIGSFLTCPSKTFPSHAGPLIGNGSPMDASLVGSTVAHQINGSLGDDGTSLLPGNVQDLNAHGQMESERLYGNISPRRTASESDASIMKGEIECLGAQRTYSRSEGCLKATSAKVEAIALDRANKNGLPPPCLQLWLFLLHLLELGKHSDDICWVDREKGLFKVVRQAAVAKAWGAYRAVSTMTYQSMARALRHYYRRQILEPTNGRLLYKFTRQIMVQVLRYEQERCP